MPLGLGNLGPAVAPIAESPGGLPNRQTTTYMIQRTLIYFPGLVQVPVAGPDGSPCQFVKIHAPYGQEYITWTATCECGPPAVPSPYGVQADGTPNPIGLNSNRVLLHMSTPVIVPVPCSDKGHIWQMSGLYIYGMVTPELPTGDIKLGCMPWGPTGPVPIQPTTNYQPGGNFQQGILDPTVRQPAFPDPLPPLQMPIINP